MDMQTYVRSFSSRMTFDRQRNDVYHSAEGDQRVQAKRKGVKYQCNFVQINKRVTQTVEGI